MKLIDILVRELPKLGGWPPAMDELYQLKSGVVIGGSATSIYSGHVFEVAEDVNNSSVNREQYESEIAASQKLSWGGVGSPPVGCECEYVGNDTSWGVVNVIGYDGDKVVFKPSGDTYYAIAPSNKCIFRPIRSEADKKRDEAIAGIYNTYMDIEHDEAVAEGIYDAIAAGKIPGVKMEG